MEKLQSGVVKMKKSMILVFLFIAMLSVPQIVLATSELEVTFETNLTEAIPGTQGYVALNLKSIGSSNVEGIQVEATSSDYSEIKPLGDWEISMGDLSSSHSTSAVFNYEVSSSASPGLYEIKFKIKTTNAGYITRYAIIQVEDFEVLDIISVAPTSLNIGEVTTLVFNITNNGGISIENVLFAWEDSSDLILPLGSDNRTIISSIASGNSTEIPIEVVVSPAIAPGVYPLTITMDYYDRTGTKQSTTSEVGIIVGGTTDFDVSLQGSTGISTTLAIANIGANTAYSVIVRIPQQMNFRASGASSSNMGNLDAGDYTLATFQIASTMDTTNRSGTLGDFSNRSGAHNDFINRSGAMADNTNLIVEISYTGMLGIRRTVQKEVTLGSGMGTGGVPSGMSGMYGQYGSQQSDNTGMMYIVIGVVGIIVLVAFLKFGKRKKK
jgi:hypothetical protein